MAYKHSKLYQIYQIMYLGVKNQMLPSKSLDLGVTNLTKEHVKIDKSLILLLKEAIQENRFYIWHTQEDDKVRPEHAANDGQVFDWNNPPPTGNPGDDYGCRCWAEFIESPNKPTYSVSEPSKGAVTIHKPDGSSETRTGGSRAWRNNNPGNLRAGTFANNHGAIGSAGGFAVFPDEETGDAASAALLRTPTYSGLSVDDAIARRSPSNENDTENLQNTIHNMSGLSGDEIVGELDDNQMSKLTDAIKRTEGWIPGTTTINPAP